jgi:molybdopterin molybdotransferase
MIHVEEARRILAKEAARPAIEEVPLEKAAGRILAGPVRADRPIPPFDRAAVDGYAVRLRGAWREGEEFEVLGLLQAGEAWPRPLRPGTAVKVMTGAPVPQGADGVVMAERSLSLGSGRVRLSGPWESTPSAPRPGIAPRGQDARRGDLVVRRGARLTPARLAVLAGVGAVDLRVFRRPRVSVLTTGREVVDPRRDPSPVQIRDTNGTLLRSFLAEAGFPVQRLGLVGADALGPLRKAIGREQGSDLLLLTGGVSAGDFDFVPEALRVEGYRVCFHKVAMRPGKPVLFAVRATKAARRAVFALPGNPVSVLVSAVEFVLPCLRAWAGCPEPGPALLRARAEKDIRRRPGLTHFVLGRLRVDEEGRLCVREVPSQGSGDYVSAAKADCLIVLPAGDPMVAAGMPALIHPLGGQPGDTQEEAES